MSLEEGVLATADGIEFESVASTTDSFADVITVELEVELVSTLSETGFVEEVAVVPTYIEDIHEMVGFDPSKEFYF